MHAYCSVDGIKRLSFSSSIQNLHNEMLASNHAGAVQEEFLQDVCAFHRSRGVKNVSPDNFPDAILNGRRLDVYNLYREVTTRGGFR